MGTVYTVIAGTSEQDARAVGAAETLLGAKRIGRRAVRSLSADGVGFYRVISPNNDWVGEMRGPRTGLQWRAIR